MTDDVKRSELACVKVTERMLLDMNRLAALEERSLSDWLYRALRQRIYGDVARLSQESRSTSVDKVDQ